MPGTAFSSANWTGYDEQSVTNPSEALTAFSLMIDVSTLSATWKSNVQSDGADIRITKGDGTTELAYDLIDWAYNAGAPTGWIRTLWSGSLSNSGTQNVRVWAGYTGGTATAYGATETYGQHAAYDASTWGYWPLHDANDRTSNERTLTGAGSLSFGGVAGLAGKATQFTRASSQFAYPDNEDFGFNGNARSCSVLFKSNDVSSDNRLIGAENGSGGTTTPEPQVWVDNFTTDRLAVFGDGNIAYGTTDPGTNWTHAGFAGNGSNETIVYVNGSNEASIASDFGQTGPLAIGASGTAYFSGLMQHVYASTVQRSVAWWGEESAQLSDNATFWGTWAWTATGGSSPTIPRFLSSIESPYGAVVGQAGIL